MHRNLPGQSLFIGKAHSRRNATKHGLLASENVFGPPDGGESRKEFIDLLAQLREHFAPADIVEDLLVQRIAICFWRQKLLLRAEIGEVHQQRETAADGASLCSDPRHSDIAVIWLGTQYDRERRRRNGNQGAASSQLTDTEERIIQKLRETDLGIKLVRIYLHQIREECERTGIVSQDHRDLLRDCCGRNADWLLSPLSRNTANPSQQVGEFLERLEEEDTSQHFSARLLASRTEANISRLSIPNERPDLLVRYDTQQARELYRALGELERLQRRRLGDLVPAPIKVEVTGGR
jgi:hypothetical protein